MADMRHLYSPPGFSADGAASTTPRSFQLKYLNVMDPLLPTNNLGRSVNKSSFARIRRALDYGARRLTAILEMVRGLLNMIARDNATLSSSTFF